MTVPQVFYQLVSRQVVDNTQNQYEAVSYALVKARLQDMIPWEWIEDRTRPPRHVPMWSDVAAFADVAGQYRRNVWVEQPGYVEVWVEKDALSGIFEAVLEPYGVTLNVGRGYDGWSSIHDAANRYGPLSKNEIVYFGDHDPSGEDMPRSLRERLALLGVEVDIEKVAVTTADIAQYNLPPNPAKRTDSRRAAFVAEHGDRCVELDALPVDVLRQRIRDEVEARMDLDALKAVEERSERERKAIRTAIETAAKEAG